MRPDSSVVSDGKFRWALDGSSTVYAADGYASISGWCFHEHQPTPVRLRFVVGDRTFDCESGFQRDDVTKAFPGLPQSCRSGFRFRGWLPHGFNDIGVEAEHGEHGWSRLGAFPACSESAPLFASVDYPAGDNAKEGYNVAEGWAAHPQEKIERLLVTFGQTRTECAVVPTATSILIAGHLRAPGCRFKCRIRLRPGWNIVTVTASLESGLTATTTSPFLFFANRAQTAAALRQRRRQKASTIKFEKEEAPDVSIVIPVLNQVDLTLACLSSVKQHTRGVRYEVIVVDDGSDRETKQCLAAVDGLKLITHTDNRGFGACCNAGAAASNGPYLLFLNNDTEVTTGWAKALLRVSRNRDDAGIVGAKLLYPNGELQEAGAMLSADGSGIKFGNGDEPDKPEYNYVRETEYCSGACIVISRHVFLRVKGFDEATFSSGYYEDVDLAFKVREIGKKVYYQPRAVVYHHEGQSAGTLTLERINLNREAFFLKWANRCPQLRTEDPSQWPITDDSMDRPQGLLFDCGRSTSAADSLLLLPALHRLGIKVTFLTTTRTPDRQHIQRLQEIGVECIYGDFATDLKTFMTLRGNQYALVLLAGGDTADTALRLCRVHAARAAVVYHQAPVVFLRAKTKRVTVNDYLELAARCDAVIVSTAAEEAELSSKLPLQRIAVIQRGDVRRQTANASLDSPETNDLGTVLAELRRLLLRLRINPAARS